MRVAVADDSFIFRRGLADVLAAGGVSLAVEAVTAEQLLALLAREPVDAVIIDLRMPPTQSDEGLRAAIAVRERWPRVGVLVLSSHAESHHAAQLLDLDVGGVGYLLKDHVDDAQALRAALDRLVAGGVVVDPDLVRDLVRHRRRGLGALSARELEVLELMAQGASNQGIATTLQLSLRTVENHVSAVFTALELVNDPEENRQVRAVLTYLRH